MQTTQCASGCIPAKTDAHLLQAKVESASTREQGSDFHSALLGITIFLFRGSMAISLQADHIDAGVDGCLPRQSPSAAAISYKICTGDRRPRRFGFPCTC